MTAARKAVKKPAKRGKQVMSDAKVIRFAELVMQGTNQSDALIAVHPPARRWTRKTVGVKACLFAKDKRVVAAMASIRANVEAAVVDRGTITLEGHLRDLQELRDKAARRGDYGAAIRAEERRGMVAGFYVERKQVAVAQTITHVDRALREIEAVMADALSLGSGDDLGVDGAERSVLPAPLLPETPRH